MLLYNIANNVHIELRFEKKSYLTKYFSIVNCSLCNFTIKKPGQNQVDHGKFFEVLPHKNFNFTSRKWKKFKKKIVNRIFFHLPRFWAKTLLKFLVYCFLFLSKKRCTYFKLTLIKDRIFGEPGWLELVLGVTSGFWNFRLKLPLLALLILSLSIVV